MPIHCSYNTFILQFSQLPFISLICSGFLNLSLPPKGEGRGGVTIDTNAKLPCDELRFGLEGKTQLFRTLVAEGEHFSLSILEHCMLVENCLCVNVLEITP